MQKTIDPSLYGLDSRGILMQLGPGHIGIIKKRKSRIIMKDGEKIALTAETLRKEGAGKKISLVISGPLCSKTRKFLTDNSIEVIEEKD